MRKLEELSDWELLGMIKTYQGKISQMVNLLDLDDKSFKRTFEETFRKEIEWKRDKYDSMLSFSKKSFSITKEQEKDIQETVANIIDAIGNRKGS